MVRIVTSGTMSKSLNKMQRVEVYAAEDQKTFVCYRNERSGEETPTLLIGSKDDMHPRVPGRVTRYKDGGTTIILTQDGYVFTKSTRLGGSATHPHTLHLFDENIIITLLEPIEARFSPERGVIYLTP